MALPPMKISRLSRVHPNSSAFAADVGLALSRAEFGRSAKTARSKNPGTIGAMRRRASDGRSGRGPSKDDSDDASEWSSSCMEVDMVFGESASSARCIGCSSIMGPFFCIGQKRLVRRAWGKCRGSYRLLLTYTGSQTQQCAHTTRCSHSCEPASMSWGRPQNLVFLCPVQCSATRCKTASVRLRRLPGPAAPEPLAGMPTPSCRGASRAPHIARAHV